jgi:hypothetical protein
MARSNRWTRMSNSSAIPCGMLASNVSARRCSALRRGAVIAAAVPESKSGASHRNLRKNIGVYWLGKAEHNKVEIATMHGIRLRRCR